MMCRVSLIVQEESLDKEKTESLAARGKGKDLTEGKRRKSQVQASLLRPFAAAAAPRAALVATQTQTGNLRSQSRLLPLDVLTDPPLCTLTKPGHDD